MCGIGVGAVGVVVTDATESLLVLNPMKKTTAKLDLSKPDATDDGVMDRVL